MTTKSSAYTNPSGNPRAAIYARYSSHSQRDVSIDQQVKACREFALQNSIEIVEIYEDRAVTGTNDRRPGFQKMIKDAEKSEWNYVIVYSLDRFARDRYDSAVYKRQLKSCGVKVLSAMENISDDPSGILMESVLEGLAEYYSKELSRKIRRGMADNASKCMVNGSLPLGYVRGEDGRYAIDEAEAEIVRYVYRKIRDGRRMADLIAELNLRGIRTKTGSPWTHSSFNRLLSNERYTGVYIYGDVRIPGGVPQIIPQALYDAVQHTIHTKKNPRTDPSLPQRRRQENGIYYLTGKLFCGHCHSPMVGVSGRSKNGPLYFYYACKGKKLERNCKKQNVNRDRIEYTIAAALKDAMFTDKAIATLADAAVDYQNRHVSNNEIDALQLRYKEITQSINNLVAAIEAGVFTATTKMRLKELEAQQRTVASQLSRAEEEAEEKLTRNEVIAALKLFKNGDLDDIAYRESLFDTFLVAVYVYDNELKIVFNLGSRRESAIIPFNIEDVAFSDTGTVSPQLHQMKQRRTPIFGGSSLFLQMVCCIHRNVIQQFHYPFGVYSATLRSVCCRNIGVHGIIKPEVII